MDPPTQTGPVDPDPAGPRPTRIRTARRDPDDPVPAPATYRLVGRLGRPDAVTSPGPGPETAAAEADREAMAARRRAGRETSTDSQGTVYTADGDGTVAAADGEPVEDGPSAGRRRVADTEPDFDRDAEWPVTPRWSPARPQSIRPPKPTWTQDPYLDTDADTDADTRRRHCGRSLVDAEVGRRGRGHGRPAGDDDVPEEAVEHAPGEVDLSPVADLWPAAAADSLRARWRELQLRFVDDPQGAAAEADALVVEAVETLTSALATRAPSWATGGPATPTPRRCGSRCSATTGSWTRCSDCRASPRREEWRRVQRTRRHPVVTCPGARAAPARSARSCGR